MPEREGQMDGLQQAVMAGQVLSIAKRDKQLINVYTMNPRWIPTLFYIGWSMWTFHFDLNEVMV